MFFLMVYFFFFSISLSSFHHSHPLHISHSLFFWFIMLCWLNLIFERCLQGNWVFNHQVFNIHWHNKAYPRSSFPEAFTCLYPKLLFKQHFLAFLPTIKWIGIINFIVVLLNLTLQYARHPHSSLLYILFLWWELKLLWGCNFWHYHRFLGTQCYPILHHTKQ